MSALVIIDDELIAKVATALHEMALAHPRSIAAEILPTHFNEVVKNVAANLDVSFPDFESALIAQTGREKNRMPSNFARRRSRHEDFKLRKLFWKAG